ncbi:MAG: 4-(cytidine 5'-diphospho)-2-C-methyl-D-erythritol kinase [Desulfohalobiaceae bacterium]|nr:4-(cytidine 5'-diphospho)-2-C-methyl-D-erythritol kinase [Desulfohalobiaceae bacterium]
MQEEAVIETGAKINICLRILGLRSDGYHELRSLFAPVASPSDTLYMRPLASGGGLALSCSLPELEDKENILYRAYESFATATGERPGLEVYLEKGVPVGSGLGGGSADAAALLTYLNLSLTRESRLGPEPLQRLAASVGSDVPFFLLGKPAWVTGAGETVSPIGAALPLTGLLIVCPRVSVSTAWAYRELDKWGGNGGGWGNGSLTRGKKGSKEHFYSPGQLWHNDFETVVFPYFPELRSLKYALLQVGARAVILNGSGGSMSAIFGSKSAVERCQRWLDQNRVPHFIAA